MRACRPTVEQCIPCGGDYPSVACGDSTPDKGSQGLRRWVLGDGRENRIEFFEMTGGFDNGTF